MYLLNSISSFSIPSPAGTYIYDIVPLSTGSELAAISSDDCLRILDSVTLKVKSEVKAAGKEVTCLRAFGGEASGVVAVAGRDGKIGLWDCRAGKGVKAGEVRSDNAPILSLACSSANSLAAGTELTNHQATVMIWDTRQLGSPAIQYVESHSDDVTELQYHPSHANILLSGSTDGLVNIFNTIITEEEDALHQTINHGSSIHHANFLSQTDIFALSHDEKFSMYELVPDTEVEKEERTVNFGDLREKLGGEYVANVLSRPDGGAVAGVGTHSRESFDLVQLKSSPSWAFEAESRVTLHGAHGSEIVRSFCFLDTHQTVLTCGEDGQIKAWRGD